MSDHSFEKPSKSQIKREMLELQDLGKALTMLSEAQLEMIVMPDELLEAIQFFHTLKSHEAQRRQLQYIGKLMREIDVTLIRKTLKKIRGA